MGWITRLFNKDERDAYQEKKYDLQLTKAQNTQVQLNKNQDMTWIPAVAGLVGQIFGRKDSNSESDLLLQQMELERQRQEAQRKQNQLFIIIGAVVAVIIIMIILTQNKK